MSTTINYTVLGVFLILVLLLVIYLIRRNNKDRKSFERDMNLSEMEPEKHSDDEHI